MLATEVLSVGDGQRQCMAARLSQEKLGVRRTTRTHEIDEFLLQRSICQNVFELHIVNVLVSDFF